MIKQLKAYVTLDKSRPEDIRIDIKHTLLDPRFKNVPWVMHKTKSDRVKIGVRHTRLQVDFILYLDDIPEGNICIERVNDRDILHWLKNRSVLTKVFTPHSSLSSVLQGLGYASAIYKSYLDRGMSFVTNRQTLDALKLWIKLGQTYERHWVHPVDIASGSGLVKTIDFDDGDDETLHVLLGRGAKLQDLFNVE